MDTEGLPTADVAVPGVAANPGAHAVDRKGDAGDITPTNDVAKLLSNNAVRVLLLVVGAGVRATKKGILTGSDETPCATNDKSRCKKES